MGWDSRGEMKRLALHMWDVEKEMPYTWSRNEINGDADSIRVSVHRLIHAFPMDGASYTMDRISSWLHI